MYLLLIPFFVERTPAPQRLKPHILYLPASGGDIEQSILQQQIPSGFKL